MNLLFKGTIVLRIAFPSIKAEESEETVLHGCISRIVQVIVDFTNVAFPKRLVGPLCNALT